MAVPIIDIAPCYQSGLEARRTVAKQIGDACESIGFFVIEGHDVPPDLIARGFQTCTEFYDLPQTIKDRYRPPLSTAARGYHKIGTKNLARTLGYDNPPDLREQFYIGPVESWAGHYQRYPHAAPLYAPNIWPDAIAEYRPVFTELYKTMERLALRIMRLFALALDVGEGYFDNKLHRHFSTLPVNDYPALGYTPLPDQVRCGEHSDFGSLTILAIGGGGSGLQVRTRNESWIDASTNSGQFIVNIGDMMQHWTNNRWVSNIHRVVNPKTNNEDVRRQSFGFFLHPNFDAKIECLPSCIDSNKSADYNSVLAGDLMLQKLNARAN